MINRNLIALSIAAFALLILAACSSKPESGLKAPSGLPTSAVVEKVNGVPITKAELDRAVKAFLAQTPAPEKVPAEAMKQATGAALNQLTAAELLYQEASKLEIKDLDKQVAAKILQNKFQYDSQTDFDKALKSVGMTQQEMELAARKDIVINHFIEQRIAPQVSVTEEDARKFYESEKEKSFKHGDRIQVSHILIGVPENANPAVKKQAKEKAEALLKKIKAGENFAALAKAESTSPTKEQGGDLGVLGKGQMIPAFEKAAFSLKAGEISNVVETQFGYHIIKVTAKLPASTDKYEDVKWKIVNHLKREKIRKALDTYIEQLRAKAKIEIM